MPQPTPEIARELARFLGVPSCGKFVQGFIREVRLIDPAGNDPDCARELANTVFVEVAEGQHSPITETDLQRALWRVSKEWQRRLKRFWDLEADIPDQRASHSETERQFNETVEEVFRCLNELPEESYTLLHGIMDGLSIEAAASNAGVPRATAYRWLKTVRKRIRLRAE